MFKHIESGTKPETENETNKEVKNSDVKDTPNTENKVSTEKIEDTSENGMPEKTDDSGKDVYQRDENGKIKTDEAGNPIFLQNQKFEINGVTYETDDNGKVYKVNGEYLPNQAYDIDGHHYETNEKGEVIKQGGSYKDVKKDSDGEKSEVHHMPADSTSPIERNDGPAIKMDKEDHKETASCGNSKEAQEYRQRQKELIDHGKFREALQMDIDDIHEKFGDKYDNAIAELLDYVDQLEKEGKI